MGGPRRMSKTKTLKGAKSKVEVIARIRKVTGPFWDYAAEPPTSAGGYTATSTKYNLASKSGTGSNKRKPAPHKKQATRAGAVVNTTRRPS